MRKRVVSLVMSVCRTLRRSSRRHPAWSTGLGVLLAAALVVSMLDITGFAAPQHHRHHTDPTSLAGIATRTHHTAQNRAAARPTTALATSGLNAPRGSLAPKRLAAPHPVKNRPSTVVQSGARITDRTMFSTTYRNPDGTVAKKLSAVPLRVRNSAGHWVPVNTSVSHTPAGPFAVRNHPLSPVFAAKSGEQRTVTEHTSAGTVSFSLDGERTVAASEPSTVDLAASGADNASKRTGVSYRGVLPHADLTYQVEQGGVKEAIVLKRAPSKDVSYTWTVHAPGLTLSTGKDGSVLYRDGKHRVVLFTPTSVMTDSSGAVGQAENALKTIPVTVRHISGGDWAMTLTPDTAWLHDTARQYPVSIDPTSYVVDSSQTISYQSSNGSDVMATTTNANIGNSRVNNGVSVWRTVAYYPYESLFGKYVLNSNLAEAYLSGTTDAHGTAASQATVWGFNCAGSNLAKSTFSAGTSGGADLDISAAMRAIVGSKVKGTPLCLQGDETLTAYTYKEISTALEIVYESFPTVTAKQSQIPDVNVGFPAQTTSPQGGALTSLTPTLEATGTKDSGDKQALNYAYSVSASSSMSNPVWSSGWTESTQATVPQAVLSPGTKYYWRIQAEDEYGATATSSVYSFTTTTPPTLGASSTYDAAAGAVIAPNGFTPADQSIVATTTPKLVAPIASTTSGKNLSTEIRVTSGTDGISGQVAQSPLCAATGSSCVIDASAGTITWTPPAGVLQDGGSYTWTEILNDGYGDYVGASDSDNDLNRLTVNLRVTDPGPAPTDSAGPVSVNLANGNVSASFSSPTVQTVGGDMGMNFSYNSLLPSNQGLTGTYYNVTGSSPTFSYTSLPSSPSLVRTDTGVGFDWGTQSPDEALGKQNFQAQWTGYITPPSGTYAFGFQSDDGAELTLGSKAIITDRWTDHHDTSPTMETGSAQVLTVTGSTWSIGSQSGQLPVPITVNYFERTGYANVYLEMQRQSGSTWGVGVRRPVLLVHENPGPAAIRVGVLPRHHGRRR